MRRRRLRPVVVTIAALLALTATVTARSENRNLIDGLEFRLLSIAIPLTVFVVLLVVYAAVTGRDTTDPRPTAEKPGIELLWIAATVLILLVVGISAYGVLASPYVSPIQPNGPAGDGNEGIEGIPETTDEELVVRGYQWGWKVTYPKANVTTRDEIVMPADEDVTIWLTADSVVHALFVSDLGIKQDAFPGEYTRLRTVVYEPGQYTAVCTEFCGAGHSRMRANVTVVDREIYDEWLEAHADEEGVPAPDPPADGQRGVEATSVARNDATSTVDVRSERPGLGHHHRRPRRTGAQ